MESQKELQNLVERSWTESAPGYDAIVEAELQSAKKDAWKTLILANTPKRQSDRLKILDIGTGPGFFPVILASEDVEVSGIDCTEEMARMAEKNVSKHGKKANIRVMDSHSLDFSDGSFDVVLSRNVSWTLSDPEKAYAEWARVVRPGGRVLIFDANWQRHYHDEEARKFFDEHDKDFFAQYGEHIEGFMNHFRDPEQARTLRRSTPMGTHQRPQWDFDVLLKLGFRRFHFDTRVGEVVWTPEEQFKNRYAPMFMISAER
ncbi:SAM-dependent methyltransferase [Synergistales bacterium]|nr:SAM-dependent methyltransferase [Synergistales bacterium]